MFPRWGNTLSLGICVSQVGEHRFTRDMCFPGGGTHITRDMCFPGGGTHITRDMCFLGGGTHRIGQDRISALLSTERLQTHVFTTITKIFVQ